MYNALAPSLRTCFSTSKYGGQVTGSVRGLVRPLGGGLCSLGPHWRRAAPEPPFQRASSAPCRDRPIRTWDLLDLLPVRGTEANSKMVPIYSVPISRSRTVINTHMNIQYGLSFGPILVLLVLNTVAHPIWEPAFLRQAREFLLFVTSSQKRPIRKPKFQDDHDSYLSGSYSWVSYCRGQPEHPHSSRSYVFQ